MKKKFLISIFIIVILSISIFIFYNFRKHIFCNKPYITFTFDDGYEEHYATAFPIFQEYNIAATAYIIVGRVGGYFGNQKLMGWDQIKELQDNGWEIGSHTLFHRNLTELDYEEINAELEFSKMVLIQNGLGVKTLAIPYGKYNEEIKTISKKYYVAARPSTWGSNSFSNLDRYNLQSFWITDSTSWEDIKSWIDEAEKNNYWIIFMIHLVRPDKSLEYTITPEDLEKIITYIKQKNIEIKTIAEVLALKCD